MLNKDQRCVAKEIYIKSMEDRPSQLRSKIPKTAAGWLLRLSCTDAGRVAVWKAKGLIPEVGAQRVVEQAQAPRIYHPQDTTELQPQPWLEPVVVLPDPEQLSFDS